MRGFFKRGFALILSLFVVLTFVPALEADAAPVFDKTTTIVMYEKNQEGYITISGLKPTQTIKKSNVKSSKKAVASITRIEKIYSKSTEHSYEKKTDKTSETNTYMIFFNIKKAGKTFIKFKIGKKSYQTKVVIKKYANPIKNIKITNVNNGKSFASKFKKKNAVNFPGVDVDNAVLTVKPGAGWKITSVKVKIGEGAQSEDVGIDNTVFNTDGAVNIKIKSMKIGNLKKDYSTTITIKAQKKKLVETITCTISDTASYTYVY